jgi:hypothetical protein
MAPQGTEQGSRPFNEKGEMKNERPLPFSIFHFLFSIFYLSFVIVIREEEIAR